MLENIAILIAIVLYLVYVPPEYSYSKTSSPFLFATGILYWYSTKPAAAVELNGADVVSSSTQSRSSKFLASDAFCNLAYTLAEVPAGR